MPKISIVIPCYFNEENIPSTAKRLIENEANFPGNLEFEYVLVDDGSKDKTGEIVEGLKKKIPNLKLITHSPNKGYGEAIKSGLYNSKYENIVFTDSDGQFDFSEITKASRPSSPKKVRY